MSPNPLIYTLDLIGTIVFALSGALVAVRLRMDLFGVLVLAFVTATSGGIMRDLLIGAVPPASVVSWKPLALSVGAGLVTFLFPRLVARLDSPVQVFDAAGLGTFAVAGAAKALAYGLPPVMAALLGMVTGIGGGMVRDVLAAEVPVVLKAEIYAVAALSGATVVVVGWMAGLPATPTAIVGLALCFVLRMVAIWRGWRLPIARPHEPPGTTPGEPPAAGKK